MRRHTLFLALMGCALFCQAQTTPTDSNIVKKDITIQKAYTPFIGNFERKELMPSTTEPEIKHKPANYSNYSTTIAPEYQVRKLGSAQLNNPVVKNAQDGYLRFGLGNCWSTLGDLMLPIVETSKYSLDFNLNHKGMYNRRKHHKTNAGLGYNRFFKNGNLYIDGNYTYRGFNYYGENKLEKDSIYTAPNGATISGADFFRDDASIHAWDFELGYKSYPTDEYENRISAEMRYDGFMPNEGLTEHRMKTNFLYEKTFNEGNHWGIDFNMENYWYNTGNLDVTASTPHGFTSVRLNPYVQIEKERLFARAGISLNVSTEGQAVAPAPDVRAIITLVKNTWYLYGGLEGDYQTHSLKDVIEENHYINLNEKIKNSYSPVDIYGGFKLKILYNLLSDLSLRYKYTINDHFFVNDTSLSLSGSHVMGNVFVSQIKDASVFTVSFCNKYEMSKLLTLNFDVKHNSWNVRKGEAWGKPKWQWNVGGELHAGKRMSAYVNFDIETGRKALKSDGGTRLLKPKYDLNIGTDYAWSSDLSLFIKLNNILHRHYEQWYGYEVNGFNGMIGLIYTF